MVLGSEEYMKAIREIVGDNPTDEQIAFMENMTDTYQDAISKTTDTENWKEKYEELDTTWKKKYTERFFTGDSGNDSFFKPNETPEPEVDEDLQRAKTITINDLFKY